LADTKPHIRTFLAQTFGELGFVSVECARADDLDAIVIAQSPDLVVIGYGIEAITMLDALAERAFDGEVLVLGPRESSMVAAVQKFGEDHGISMLPPLATPFGSEALRSRVAALLPGETPPSHPIDLGEALNAGWLELWYQPKINTQTLQLCGVEALIRVRHPAGASCSRTPSWPVRTIFSFALCRNL
jgi:DNA-binding response OmpR family regulator